MICTVAVPRRDIAVRRLVAGLHAHSVRRDRALVDQRVQSVVHLIAGQHRGRRAVQLDEVESVDAEVAAGPIGPGTEVVEGVALGDLVDPATHLGGHGDATVRMLGQESADQLLAAAVPVHVGGVEEGHSGLHRCSQYAERVGFRRPSPSRRRAARCRVRSRTRDVRYGRERVAPSGQPRDVTETRLTWVRHAGRHAATEPRGAHLRQQEPGPALAGRTRRPAPRGSAVSTGRCTADSGLRRHRQGDVRGHRVVELDAHGVRCRRS